MCGGRGGGQLAARENSSHEITRTIYHIPVFEKFRVVSRDLELTCVERQVVPGPAAAPVRHSRDRTG